MKQTKSKEKKKGRVTTIVLIIILVVGVCVLCYPFVSNLWNTRVQSRAINAYNESYEAMTKEEVKAAFAAADEFNANIRQLGSATTIYRPDLLKNYESTLDITGTGIMGYVTIEKIDVELPIYHGTSSSVLNVGAGHLEGTSLPVGGKGTHCVISAHRGLPSSKLFTDLDKLEIGDTFTLTVLGEVLTYEVDNISIVLPNEAELIYVDEDEDYCTLMTCTPYGINTHRLLVRGVRTDNDDTNVHITSDAYQIDTLVVAAVAAVPIFAILLIWLIVSTNRKRKRGNNKWKD